MHTKFPFNTIASLKLSAKTLSADIAVSHYNTVTKPLLYEQKRLLHINQLLVLALVQADVVNTGIAKTLAKHKHLSQYDELTGAPNRRIMQDRIQQLISSSARRQHTFAVLFIDLDHFKPVNDRYGHAVGDKVLQHVVSRLNQTIRASDTLSRHGGDEFLLLLPEVTHYKAVCAIAEKMLQALSAVYSIDGHAVSLSASIGIALFPEDGLSFASLVNKADSAMYKAKGQGGGCFCC